MIRKFPQDQLTDCEPSIAEEGEPRWEDEQVLPGVVRMVLPVPIQNTAADRDRTPRRSQQGHPEESRRMSVASTVEPERADRAPESKGKISKEENRRS